MTAPQSTDGSTEGESTEIATSTLAEIYEKQGLYDRAIAIWRKLARRAPEDREIAERIEDLGRRLEAAREEERAADSGAAGEGEPDGSEEIPIPTDEGSPPVVAPGEGSLLEVEAARTGPPEEAAPDAEAAEDEEPAAPVPSPDEDERFQAWLAGK